MNVLVVMLALSLFYLTVWWQHKRDGKEDRAIAAWLDPLVLGLWSGICKAWQDCRQWNQCIGVWDKAIRKAQKSEKEARRMNDGSETQAS